MKVDVTYIDNAADAHLLAADRLAVGAPPAGKAYFISNGEPVELWAFIDRVLAEAGICILIAMSCIIIGSLLNDDPDI